MSVNDLTVKEYQTLITNHLRNAFAPHGACAEWRSIRDIPGTYSPRIDVAVGPFATIRGGNRINEYDYCIVEHLPFFQTILSFHQQTIRRYQPEDLQLRQSYVQPTLNHFRSINQNARCLLAIEIENKVSRKHLLGSALNASVLGRVGVMIPWTCDKVRAMVNLLHYWSYLRSVGKNAFDARNLVIIKKEEFPACIQASSGFHIRDFSQT